MKTPEYVPLWLTANDLARLLGVSRRTIRRWHVQGRLPPPAYFSKRTLRWSRDDISILFLHGPAEPGFFFKKRRVKE